jgi:hypothetical protein
LKIAIKPINNPNGVFNGVIRYNWWSEVVKDPNIVQYFSVFCIRLLLHNRRYTYDLKMMPQYNRMLKYNITSFIKIVSVI